MGQALSVNTRRLFELQGPVEPQRVFVLNPHVLTPFTLGDIEKAVSAEARFISSLK
ncbi:MAG: hypothetical protein K8R21_13280 [Leptospira sp.]|nr:hypothetical protein [Leptospira sp.]